MNIGRNLLAEGTFEISFEVGIGVVSLPGRG